MSSSSDEDELVAEARRRHLRMSKVNMPTGIKVSVTIPATACSCSTCSFHCKQILLEPTGRLGRRERRIIVTQMQSTIQQHVLQEQGGGRFTSYDVVTVHKIQNPCLWKRFRNREKQLAADVGYVNQRMLFHGTTAADTIISTGFNTSFAKPSGMFGTGVYFAEDSSKSNQYVYGLLGGNGCPAHKDKSCYSCTRKMLLCRVALGKMHRLTSANKMSAPPTGYNSISGVPGGGLKFPEYAVYSGDQAYPEYLITYKIVK